MAGQVRCLLFGIQLLAVCFEWVASKDNWRPKTTGVTALALRSHRALGIPLHADFPVLLSALGCVVRWSQVGCPLENRVRADSRF